MPNSVLSGVETVILKNPRKEELLVMHVTQNLYVGFAQAYRCKRYAAYPVYLVMLFVCPDCGKNIVAPNFPKLHADSNDEVIDSNDREIPGFNSDSFTNTIQSIITSEHAPKLRS